MKKLLLVLASVCVCLNLASQSQAGENTKVPVQVGEAIIKITIPVPINDNNVVIQATTSREMPWVRKGEIAPYQVDIFYPMEWGQLSVQHHLTAGGKDGGVYTLTFARITGQPNMSFTLDVKHPLANLEKKEKADLLPKLSEGLGGDVSNLALVPGQWLIQWQPTEREELREIIGLADTEDSLLIVEKVKLPPQTGGQLPFTLKKVSASWGIVDRDEVKSLVGQDEVMPYLAGIKNQTPIRVKEGYLKWCFDPNFQGSYAGGQGMEWRLMKNKTLIQVVPFMEYLVATK